MKRSIIAFIAAYVFMFAWGWLLNGVFLKGVGVSVLWPQMVALAIYGVTVLGLSALRFRKTLD